MSGRAGPIAETAIMPAPPAPAKAAGDPASAWANVVRGRWPPDARVEFFMRAHQQSCPVAVPCPRDQRRTATDHMGRGKAFMMQDLAAVAPSVIVCAAFLIGAWAIVRRELAPKRRARARAGAVTDKRVEDPAERDQGRS